MCLPYIIMLKIIINCHDVHQRLSSDSMTKQNLSRQQCKTRSALMNAAIQLIINEGYGNLTVKGITDQADYGRRVFYMYFKDKEDIVYHIITTWIARTSDKVFAQVQDYQTPEREYRAFRLMITEYLQYISFFQNFGGHVSTALRRRVIQFCERDVQKHLDLGNLQLQEGVPDKFASKLHISTMLEFVKTVRSSTDKLTVDEMADTLFRFVYNQAPPQID